MKPTPQIVVRRHWFTHASIWGWKVYRIAQGEDAPTAYYFGWDEAIDFANIWALRVRNGQR